MRKEDAVIVCGLGYGDEGKGSIVDALARRFGPTDVIRYNGGPQAGHNVVDPDGRWHCFAQFGAGTFRDDSRTVLGPKMLVATGNLEAEEEALRAKGVRDAYGRLTIDPECLIVTPPQKFVGRMREIARGDARHGSCGQGVGETIRDAEEGLAVDVGHLLTRRAGLRRLARLYDAKLEQASRLRADAPSEAMQDAYRSLMACSDAERQYRRMRLIFAELDVEEAAIACAEASKLGRGLIFEGAQGALLDRRRGFAPHVTKSDTTCRNALDLCQASAPFKLGILRAYGHRHGAGPFTTEDESLRQRFDDALNRRNDWQGPFRVGWLDLPALRYGIRINGDVDGLALTCLDRLSGLKTVRVCASYQDAEGKVWTDFPTDGRQLTDWVHGCRPLDWIESDGWAEDLTRARRFGDLPKAAQGFLRFLESKEALGAPLEIVSVGPRSDQKLFLEP